ncbi:MAG: PAS domain-containing protein [Nitrospirae bacterium]|nr:PAS domain-containing protein [Nitrospirota bacterium]
MFKSIKLKILAAQIVMSLLTALTITIFRNAAIIFLIVLGISIIISRKLSYSITAPIIKLSRTTQGDFLQKVHIDSNDEIGFLAASINRLMETLQKTMRSCEAFQEQSEFLKHVVNSIPYPFIVLNAADFSVKLANSAASQSGDFKNMPCYEIAKLSDMPCVGHEHKCCLESIKETKEPVIIECLHHDKDDNNRYYRIHAHPIFNDGGDVTEIIEYSIDVTESKRAEIDIIMYAEKLRISNREFQEFSYVASHDLQEPLRKVTAFGDRLKATCGDALGEKGSDYLERMLNSAKRMQNLINGLLAFCHVTTKAQPLVHVDLSVITKEVLSDLEVRIEQTGGRVEVGDLPTLNADPLQMRQLLQNLIGNSLKFHKKDEPPVVKISGSFINSNGNNPTIGLDDGKPYQIMVTDNGIGFDEKYAERIFGVFQRLHGRQEYEGTGIGLSVCKKIVERHGGTITAKSTPGEGTTFIVTLPVKQSN